jgi:hypothetical protein
VDAGLRRRRPGPRGSLGRRHNRIRCAKDTGLRNLPLKGFAQNQVWCEIVALACELLAWTQLLALAGTARRWEPKRLRLRLLSVAGRLARGGRRLRLRLAQRWPWPARSPPLSHACRPCHPADQRKPSPRLGQPISAIAIHRARSGADGSELRILKRYGVEHQVKAELVVLAYVVVRRSTRSTVMTSSSITYMMR